MTFRDDLADHVCSLVPLWRVLFGLELVFLVLLGLAAALGDGDAMALIVLNLAFLVPTTVGLAATIRWCGHRG